MDQLFLVNFQVASPAISAPTVSLSLSVDVVSRSLRGHATIDIAQSRRVSFPVQGTYMALDGIPGILQLRNSSLFYPVMYEPQFDMLIALPDGWNKGTASFVFSDGKQQDATRFDNAIVTSGPLMHVSDCNSVR